MTAAETILICAAGCVRESWLSSFLLFIIVD